jgi:hypothetical protein
MHSRIGMHFARASDIVVPKKLIHRVNDVKALLTVDFLTTHHFACGAHAIMPASAFQMEGKPLGCAIITQKTLNGKPVQDLYVTSRASERAYNIIGQMNSDETRAALEAFKNAYEMNIHFSAPSSWGRDRHPWNRNRVS